jgi:hypothetical protein
MRRLDGEDNFAGGKMRRVLLVLLFLGAAFAEERRLEVEIAHREPGEPSRIVLTLDPDIGRGELSLSLQRGRPGRGEGYWFRRKLRPESPGRYSLDYRFPETGLWSVWVHHGTGLAGYSALTRLEIDPVPGEVEHASAHFRYWPSQAQQLPGWVQPVGYSGFALVTALIILVVARILGAVRRQLDGSSS